ncbi:MAG: hypothetical protein KAR19_01880 [Bacteroidales bacterium]|nr:hypothetical protein [Bacteroidales bacterium]
MILSIHGEAQQNPGFSKPDLSVKDGYLLISYDILDSHRAERYHVRIEVTDSSGKSIEPKSVTGDIGENVTGGMNKQIRWNLIADNISMDQGVSVQIFGKRIMIEEIGAKTQEISRMGAVMRSAAFPGWGLSKLNPGQPHWIKGVAGYGALAGSLIYNQRSYVNYQNYLDSSDKAERENYYNKSLRQGQLSVVMVFTATGIWVADIIWTIVGAKPEDNHSSTVQLKGISIGTNYESSSNIPMLSLRYTF